MRAGVKADNRRINRLRSVVERTIAPVLTWRVLHSGCRVRWVLMGGCFLLARGLIFFAARTPYE